MTMVVSDPRVFQMASEGPPENTEWQPYTVQCVSHELGVTSVTDFAFQRAKWAHYPDEGKPKYLIVWSCGAVHILDYNQVNYAYSDASKLDNVTSRLQ